MLSVLFTVTVAMFSPLATLISNEPLIPNWAASVSLLVPVVIAALLVRFTPSASCVTSNSWLTFAASALAVTVAMDSLAEDAVFGDSVACMRVAIGEWWITAVLDRAEGTPQTWHCDGPARLEVGGGLAIAGADVRIDSPRFAVRSRSVEFTADETLFVGERMSLMSRQVRFVGAMLHSVFDRVSHFSRSYLRRTEGLDRVQAEHLEQEADTLLRISSEHTLIDGEKLVKARGGQIHFG